MARWLEAEGEILGFREELGYAWNPKNAVRCYALVELDSGERIKIRPMPRDVDFLAAGDWIRFKYVPGKEDKFVEGLTRL